MAKNIYNFYWDSGTRGGLRNETIFFSEISIFENLCSHDSNASKTTQLVFEKVILYKGMDLVNIIIYC